MAETGDVPSTIAAPVVTEWRPVTVCGGLGLAPANTSACVTGTSSWTSGNDQLSRVDLAALRGECGNGKAMTQLELESEEQPEGQKRMRASFTCCPVPIKGVSRQMRGSCTNLGSADASSLAAVFSLQCAGPEYVLQKFEIESCPPSNEMFRTKYTCGLLFDVPWKKEIPPSLPNCTYQSTDQSVNGHEWAEKSAADCPILRQKEGTCKQDDLATGLEQIAGESMAMGCPFSERPSSLYLLQGFQLRQCGALDDFVQPFSACVHSRALDSAVVRKGALSPSPSPPPVASLLSLSGDPSESRQTQTGVDLSEVPVRCETVKVSEQTVVQRTRKTESRSESYGILKATTNMPYVPSGWTSDMVAANAVDGVVDPTNHDFPRGQSSCTNWRNYVQLDMGASVPMNGIRIWTPWGDFRVYCHLKVQVSDDPSFPSSNHHEVYNHVEKQKGHPFAQGMFLQFTGTVTGRYVRVYQGLNNVDDWSHLMEVKVYKPYQGREYDLEPLTVLKATTNLPKGDPAKVIDGWVLHLDDKDDRITKWDEAPHGPADCHSYTNFIELDLGGVVEISAVRLWMYWLDRKSFCRKKVVVSESADFSHAEDVYVSPGFGEPERAEGHFLYFTKTVWARYVRVYAGASTIEDSTQFLEAQVYSPFVATHRQLQPVSVTGSVQFDSGRDVNKVIDGRIDSHVETDAHNCTDQKYVQLDMGEVFELSAVRLWMYWNDGRSYCGKKVLVSDSESFSDAVEVFAQPGYSPAETSDGQILQFSKTVWGRYVRVFAARNTRDARMHIAEVKVYAPFRASELKPVKATTNMGSGDPMKAIDGFPIAELSRETPHTPGGQNQSPDCSNPEWFIQLDMGNPVQMNAVRLWSYWLDGRSYCGKKVLVSDSERFSDSVEVFAQQGYGPGPESAEGQLLSFSKTLWGRYLRVYISRSTADTGSNVIEVKVFGPPGSDPVRVPSDLVNFPSVCPLGFFLQSHEIHFEESLEVSAAGEKLKALQVVNRCCGSPVSFGAVERTEVESPCRPLDGTNVGPLRGLEAKCPAVMSGFEGDPDVPAALTGVEMESCGEDSGTFRMRSTCQGVRLIEKSTLTVVEGEKNQCAKVGDSTEELFKSLFPSGSTGWNCPLGRYLSFASLTSKGCQSQGEVRLSSGCTQGLEAPEQSDKQSVECSDHVSTSSEAACPVDFILAGLSFDGPDHAKFKCCRPKQGPRAFPVRTHSNECVSVGMLARQLQGRDGQGASLACAGASWAFQKVQILKCPEETNKFRLSFTCADVDFNEALEYLKGSRPYDDPTNMGQTAAYKIKGPCGYPQPGLSTRIPAAFTAQTDRPVSLLQTTALTPTSAKASRQLQPDRPSASLLQQNSRLASPLRAAAVQSGKREEHDDVSSSDEWGAFKWLGYRTVDQHTTKCSRLDLSPGDFVSSQSFACHVDEGWISDFAFSSTESCGAGSGQGEYKCETNWERGTCATFSVEQRDENTGGGSGEKMTPKPIGRWNLHEWNNTNIQCPTGTALAGVHWQPTANVLELAQREAESHTEDAKKEKSNEKRWFYYPDDSSTDAEYGNQPYLHVSFVCCRNHGIFTGEDAKYNPLPVKRKSSAVEMKDRGKSAFDLANVRASCVGPDIQHSVMTGMRFLVENDHAAFEATCQEINRGLDGGFSEWSDWGPCTSTCQSFRFRSCTNPPPQRGGLNCDEDAKTVEVKVCEGECEVGFLEAPPVKVGEVLASAGAVCSAESGFLLSGAVQESCGQSRDGEAMLRTVHECRLPLDLHGFPPAKEMPSVNCTEHRTSWYESMEGPEGSAECSGTEVLSNLRWVAEPPETLWHPQMSLIESKSEPEDKTQFTEYTAQKAWVQDLENYPDGAIDGYTGHGGYYYPHGRGRDCSSGPHGRVVLDLGAVVPLNAIRIWQLWWYHKNTEIRWCGNRVDVSTFDNFPSDGSHFYVVPWSSTYLEPETEKGNFYPLLKTVWGRYIRVWVSRSNVNNEVYLNEFKAYGPVFLRAQELSVAHATDNFPEGNPEGLINTMPSTITWGKMVAGPADCNEYSKYVQLDMGGAFDMSGVRVWSYWRDGRRFCRKKVEASDSADFSEKEILFEQPGEGPPETDEGQFLQFSKTVRHRYLRVFVGASTAQSDNRAYLNGIKVYGQMSVPTHQLKVVTATTNMEYGDPLTVIDGITEPTDWNNAYKNHPHQPGIDCTPKYFVQLDMGAEVELSAVRTWYAPVPGARFCGVRVEVSLSESFSDSTTAFSKRASRSFDIYNNRVDDNYAYLPNEFTEGEFPGHFLQFEKTVRGRFVRIYVGRNTLSNFAHLVEAKVYGPFAMPQREIQPLAASTNCPVGDAMKMVGNHLNTEEAAFKDLPNSKGTSCGKYERYVQLDMGSSVQMSAVRLWMYWHDVRSYCGKKVTVSDSSDFKHQQEAFVMPGYGPDESIDGTLLQFPSAVWGRYVRIYVSRNTKNDGVHFIHAKVYGTPKIDRQKEEVGGEGGRELGVHVYVLSLRRTDIRAELERKGNVDSCTTVSVLDAFRNLCDGHHSCRVETSAENLGVRPCSVSAVRTLYAQYGCVSSNPRSRVVYSCCSALEKDERAAALEGAMQGAGASSMGSLAGIPGPSMKLVKGAVYHSKYFKTACFPAKDGAEPALQTQEAFGQLECPLGYFLQVKGGCERPWHVRPAKGRGAGVCEPSSTAATRFQFDCRPNGFLSDVSFDSCNEDTSTALALVATGTGKGNAGQHRSGEAPADHNVSLPADGAAKGKDSEESVSLILQRAAAGNLKVGGTCTGLRLEAADDAHVRFECQSHHTDWKALAGKAGDPGSFGLETFIRMPQVHCLHAYGEKSKKKKSGILGDLKVEISADGFQARFAYTCCLSTREELTGREGQVVVKAQTACAPVSDLEGSVPDNLNFGCNGGDSGYGLSSFSFQPCVPTNWWEPQGWFRVSYYCAAANWVNLSPGAVMDTEDWGLPLDDTLSECERAHYYCETGGSLAVYNGRSACDEAAECEELCGEVDGYSCRFKDSRWAPIPRPGAHTHLHGSSLFKRYSSPLRAPRGFSHSSPSASAYRGSPTSRRGGAHRTSAASRRARHPSARHRRSLPETAAAPRQAAVARRAFAISLTELHSEVSDSKDEAESLSVGSSHLKKSANSTSPSSTDPVKEENYVTVTGDGNGNAGSAADSSSETSSAGDDSPVEEAEQVEGSEEAEEEEGEEEEEEDPSTQLKNIAFSTFSTDSSEWGQDLANLWGSTADLADIAMEVTVEQTWLDTEAYFYNMVNHFATDPLGAAFTLAMNTDSAINGLSGTAVGDFAADSYARASGRVTDSMMGREAGATYRMQKMRDEGFEGSDEELEEQVRSDMARERVTKERVDREKEEAKKKGMTLDEYRKEKARGLGMTEAAYMESLEEQDDLEHQRNQDERAAQKMSEQEEEDRKTKHVDDRTRELQEKNGMTEKEARAEAEAEAKRKANAGEEAAKNEENRIKKMSADDKKKEAKAAGYPDTEEGLKQWEEDQKRKARNGAEREQKLKEDDAAARAKRDGISKDQALKEMDEEEKAAQKEIDKQNAERQKNGQPPLTDEEKKKIKADTEKDAQKQKLAKESQAYVDQQEKADKYNAQKEGMLVEEYQKKEAANKGCGEPGSKECLTRKRMKEHEEKQAKREEEYQKEKKDADKKKNDADKAAQDQAEASKKAREIQSLPEDQREEATRKEAEEEMQKEQKEEKEKKESGEEEKKTPEEEKKEREAEETKKKEQEQANDDAKKKKDGEKEKAKEDAKSADDFEKEIKAEEERQSKGSSGDDQKKKNQSDASSGDDKNKKVDNKKGKESEKSDRKRSNSQPGYMKDTQSSKAKKKGGKGGSGNSERSRGGGKKDKSKKMTKQSGRSASRSCKKRRKMLTETGSTSVHGHVRETPSFLQIPDFC
uniref:F5/8 type C domain-containing protein n=1 Tax=Chromera velia CCMP2878 TaxID=1169474 RepID=A0A0G4HV28_9ALVE|eukprot:Cvel_8724.t1-p1 / transcript=Cvel_8724.t1 / gene=Cvel_8724 / organism=Chromera_velia_CCMP2878 / gene_product=Netrin receptor unc-5, putative / transcript_product=Netrin receptor unc-5, putative / location=Cvel_scaffold487:66681-85734(-) / protein_length=3893 / sequence_SO=supercontig / SO=protein_coding / is_pseudo=false